MQQLSKLRCSAAQHLGQPTRWLCILNMSKSHPPWTTHTPLSPFLSAGRWYCEKATSGLRSLKKVSEVCILGPWVWERDGRARASSSSLIKDEHTKRHFLSTLRSSWPAYLSHAALRVGHFGQSPGPCECQNSQTGHKAQVWVPLPQCLPKVGWQDLRGASQMSVGLLPGSKVRRVTGTQPKLHTLL